MCDQQSLRSACAYAQSDQSLCSSLEYSISIKLLIENWEVLCSKEVEQARLSLHLSKCQIDGNLLPWLIYVLYLLTETERELHCMEIF